LALHWFRRHHKRLLLPLAVVVIVGFVILPNLQKQDGGGKGGWVRIGGETITARQVAAYRQALMMIARAGVPVEYNELYYISAAKLAERAGVRISAEQARDAIRAIMSLPGLLGKRDFTNAEYRAMLNELKVMPAVFEDFVRRFLAAETLREVMRSAGYLGSEELKLAFKRDNDRVKLRVKDFKVADFEKEVAAPTDEEIAKYYEEHKLLPLDDSIALATEPEVSIEYAFVERKGAEALAKSLRLAEEAVRFEGLLGGPGAALAGRLASATLEADREERVTSQYEIDKLRGRHKVPPPKPKEAPKPAPAENDKKEEKKDDKGDDKKDEKKDARKDGAVTSGGAGLASMIALPALAAPAPEEPPVEPEPPEEPPVEPEEKFKPLVEVRDLVERSVDRSAYRGAAEARARRFREIASDHELLRPVGGDALGEGLALGVVPALAGTAGTPARFDVLRACEEAGAVHGITRLAKADALKVLPRLGSMRRIPETAVSRAASGTGGEWTGPERVGPGRDGSGSAVWRVADYVEPRLLTLDEAKETIRKRIVHERAAELAADAADKFRRKLQRGEAGVAEMTLTPALMTGAGKAQPFAMLGIAEVAREVVAVGREGDATVSVDVPARAAMLVRVLEEAGADIDEIVTTAGRLAAETSAWETALFRVAVPVERVEPGHSRYARWRNQPESRRNRRPTPQKLTRSRGAFMIEIWNDIAREEIEYEESPEFTESRGRR